MMPVPASSHRAVRAIFAVLLGALIWAVLPQSMTDLLAQSIAHGYDRGPASTADLDFARGPIAVSGLARPVGEVVAPSRTAGAFPTAERGAPGVVHAHKYGYDTPTIAPVDTRAIAAAEASQSQVGGVQRWSTSQSAAAQGVSTTSFRSFVATNTGPSIVETETMAARPLKATEATNRWEEFLGEGPYTNSHPRTGVSDPNRIVSADGARSIRMGPHEMNSSPTKFHFHEETWSFDSSTNTWNIANVIQRVPLK